MKEIFPGYLALSLKELKNICQKEAKMGIQLTRVEDFQPYLGLRRVVRFKYPGSIYRGEWTYAILGYRFESFKGGEFGVSCTVQVSAKSVHSMQGITREDFEKRGIVVELAEKSEYEGVEFSYGYKPDELV